MSFQDWIFSFHLLFAATLGGGLVMSWIVVAIVLGLPGTIALGIWLAILRPEFRPWDGWIIGAIVLWVIATAAVLRSFVEYRKPVTKSRELLASGGRYADLVHASSTLGDAA